MKKQEKIYFVFIFLFLIGQTSLFAQRIVTDSFEFGFEGTSVSDWTQVAGFESETTIVSSGSKSMSASMNYPQQSPKLQTYRNSNSSNGFFELVAGDYTLSVMVYLVGDVPSLLKITPTSEPFIPNFSLQGIEKGRWVKLEKTFTVAQNEERDDAWLVVQFLSLPASGSGTVYIDDLIISENEEEKTPSTVKIETLEDANLNLTKGIYNINLKVWVDPSATINNFYTNVNEPWASIKWDIENVTKGQWVTLEETFKINEDAVNSKFIIQVHNNPEYGGGTGVFYIDDIVITSEDSLSTESVENIKAKIFPNPVTNILHIELSKKANIILFDILGNKVFSKNNIVNQINIPVNTLSKGIYIVQVSYGAETSKHKILVN